MNQGFALVHEPEWLLRAENFRKPVGLNELIKTTAPVLYS
jgi:hypothetical protein